MKNLYLRLLQLREELEASAASPENGLSVLYAIRRELLRHYDDLPFAQLSLCSHALQDQFYAAQKALRQPVAFPTPSASAQYVDTEQALSILERVAACTKKQHSFA
ncbi:hypothetical protein [Hymenobacter norwichensis]|uniref:hypothetical protein n=1 Tax=Hymenobacter norwichensis TaxID=223903 RepID=UPI0003B3C515|nr:hypothetical protein [Hymenobacter norwichensis]